MNTSTDWAGNTLQRMVRRFSTFLGLPFQEQMLLVQTTAALYLTVMAVRMVRFQRFRVFLGELENAHDNKARVLLSSRRAQVETTVRRLRKMTACCPLRPSCLEFSTALWWLLRRQGIASQLKIGTFTEENHFQAHAWVECEGAVISEGRDLPPDIVPFDRPFLN